ncbi:MAG: hypothetical protein AAGJ55_09355 [Cyanobacteria bacterium J06555_12]
MTNFLDWTIIFAPGLLAAWASLFGGARLFFERIEDAGVAAGLYGTMLCFPAAAAHSWLLSHSAQSIMSKLTTLYWLLAFGSLALALWCWLGPSKSSDN